MTPGQASQTEQFTAIMRANHHLFAEGQKLLEDDLALPLSGSPNAESVEQVVSAFVG